MHHVNGEGEDAGVVYCEMQGRENTAEELSAFLLARHMYPGHCGYKSNTGGKMSNLRDSCSNEKVEVLCLPHDKYHFRFCLRGCSVIGRCVHTTVRSIAQTTCAS